MKITAIIGSPRKNGDCFNTIKMLESSFNRISETQVDYVFLKDLDLGFCKSCLLCYTKGEQYCQMTAIGWGFDIAGVVGVCGSSLSTDEKYKMDVQSRIDKLVDKICKNKKEGQPSLYQLAMFRAMQCKAIKSAQKKNVEYNYWLERGWLDKNYYTSKKIGLARKIYSEFLKHVMRKMMNGKNILIN